MTLLKDLKSLPVELPQYTILSYTKGWKYITFFSFRITVILLNSPHILLS